MLKISVFLPNAEQLQIPQPESLGLPLFATNFSFLILTLDTFLNTNYSPFSSLPAFVLAVPSSQKALCSPQCCCFKSISP